MNGGYDPEFLRVSLAMPDTASATVLLPYTHFSVRLFPKRRLAAVVGVNIHGRELNPLAREGTWHFDPRVPEDQQAGPAVYKNNVLDRGHLVRRLDPVWGDDVTARAANQDTFTFTNAAPQVDDFNQGKELWVGLEDHVLNHADLHDARLSVFTGPVFADDDPPYRGIQIPRKFWKVAAWTMDGQLASAGFLVDQSPLLDRADLEKAIRERSLTGEPPPLGPFRTFQMPVHELARLTGLSLAALVLADRLTSRQRSFGEEPRAVRLERAEEIRL